MNSLAQYLDRKKLNQAALAQRVGTTQATISRLASGSQNPNIKLAQKIAVETDGCVPVSDWPHFAAILGVESGGQAA